MLFQNIFLSFFTNFPDLRFYFKGAQNYTADDVQKSDRFVKQGQRLLLGVHMLVLIFNNKPVFHAYIRETVNRHRIYKMEPGLWKVFIFFNFKFILLFFMFNNKQIFLKI